MGSHYRDVGNRRFENIREKDRGYEMTASTDIFGKKGDGVSSQTHAAMKTSGVGPYEDAPPPPPPPPPQQTQSQVGSIELQNEKKLKEMLKKRGMSDADADRKIREHKKQHGYR